MWGDLAGMTHTNGGVDVVRGDWPGRATASLGQPGQACTRTPKYPGG